VQRDGKLAGTEVGAEMAAYLPHGVDDVLADLLGQLRQLLLGERLQVVGAVYAVEDVQVFKMSVCR